MLADWLPLRPDYRVDRAPSLDRNTRGIGVGAPEVAQVADGPHLFTNMRQVLDRWLAAGCAGFDLLRRCVLLAA